MGRACKGHLKHGIKNPSFQSSGGTLRLTACRRNQPKIRFRPSFLLPQSRVSYQKKPDILTLLAWQRQQRWYRPGQPWGCRRVGMDSCRLTRGPDIVPNVQWALTPTATAPLTALLRPEPNGRVATWVNVMGCVAALTHCFGQGIRAIGAPH